MADMLTIASLSANTFKKALEVTSNNVANVATEGYNKQRVIIQSSAPGNAGNAYQGSGSEVGAIERIYSEYFQTQLYSSQTSLDRYETQLTLSKQVEGVVASNDEGIQEFMDRYFASLQTLANNPTSTTNRQQVVQEAGNLESYIMNMTTVLDETERQANSQISDTIQEVNNSLEAIRDMNRQIDHVLKNTINAPNDLMDKRDQAILELSKMIDVKTYYHENGMVDIYTGRGSVPLLSSNTLMRLEASNSEFQLDNRVEVYAYIGDQKQQISDRIAGGQIGGILDFRDNMLTQAQNDLGLALNGLVASMNWQHYQGYDMSGDAGGNLFQPLSMKAIISEENSTTSLNAGTHNKISVSFNPNAGVSEPPYDGLSALTSQPATYGDKQTYLDNAYAAIAEFEPRDYEVIYNASTDEFDFKDYTTGELLLDSTGAQVSIARGTVGTVEGLTFDFSTVTAAEVQNEDAFLIKPHKQMLEDFTSVLSDPSQLATRGQSPIDSDSDGTLDDEVPAAGGIGDNSNMLNLAALQNAKVLFAGADGNPSESLLGGYSKMSVNIGMYVRGTDIQQSAQQSVHQVMIEQRESNSGVSLDEEAANLIKYQQAYEASAQIIANVQEMFRTLLNIAGRI